DLRYSFLDWIGNDSDTPPPTEIQFVEYENVGVGEPWGHWVLEDGTKVVCQNMAKHHPNERHAITVTRCVPFRMSLCPLNQCGWGSESSAEYYVRSTGGG